jgi:hypothetical protein
MGSGQGVAAIVCGRPAPWQVQAMTVGAVIHYDDPLDPVATDDWEALT